MSEASNKRNPRKRNAQQMMMFKRAIFALGKNDNNNKTGHSTSRPSKRARIVVNNASNDLNQNTNNNNSNTHSISRPSQSKSFNSFSTPRNFFHDQISHNKHNNNNSKSLQSIRHTPKTRLLHPNKNNTITTRKQRQNDNRRSFNNNHHNNNNGDMKYNYVERCRMKKLWTDLSANESVLSQLHFCRDTSFFITSNSIAHKISLVIKLLLNEYFASKNVKFNNKTHLKILDGLACIGGNTYSFAKIFSGQNHKIYANELDAERYHALKHNMRVFAEHAFICNEKEKYHFYNMDFNELHNELNSVDVIFLDPEWNNGDDYKQTNRGQIHLFDIGGLHLYEVIDNILTKWYENVKIVAIKVAKNYDQEFIHRKLQKCKLIEDKMYRVGEVGFHNQKLIVIVKSFESGKVEEVEEDEDDDVDKQKQSGLSFEEIFKCLPKMINKNNFGNNRDVIAVKVLS